MGIKELFKMVEQSNKLSALLDESGKVVEIQIGKYFGFEKVSTYKEYKKFIKDTFPPDVVETYLNMTLTQDAKYNNYFIGTEPDFQISIQ